MDGGTLGENFEEYAKIMVRDLKISKSGISCEIISYKNASALDFVPSFF